jgi:hypothetical protein
MVVAARVRKVAQFPPALALLLALVFCIAVSRQASALPAGVTLERIDVTLEIPDPARDPMLQTKHTVVLHATSTLSATLTLGIAPLVVLASELTTGALIRTSRRTTEDDAFTDVTLPSGSSQVKLEFTAPLFEGAIPRFWWDETQIVLGWPFAADLTPKSQGVMVTILAPPSLGRPPGFACFSETGRSKCSRFFAPAELARYKDTRGEGLVIGSLPADDPMPLIVSGGQVALWCLLLLVVAGWIFTRANAPTGKERLSVILRTGLSLIVLAPCLVAFALVIDGESDGPLAGSMSWTSGVFGLSALLLAHANNPKRPLRTKLGQLMTLGSMPFAVAIVALAKAPDAAPWIVGMTAFFTLIIIFGENKE